MPIKPPTRGVQNKQEISSRDEWRDIRTWGQKFRAWVEQGDALFFLGIMTLTMMWLFPRAMEIIFILGILLFRWASKLEFALPFRMPASSKLLDHNDPDLKTDGKTAGLSDGISFLGNEKDTRKELWLKGDDMRTHLLVFGSTGAGKALRDDERVLTPSGWRRLDSLVEGEVVLTPDGKPTRVEGVYPQGDLPLWEVTLEDGRSLEASGDHLWEAKGRDGVRVLKTEEMAAQLVEQAWQLPMALPRDMPATPFSLVEALPALLSRLHAGADLPECDLGSLQQRQDLKKALAKHFLLVRKANGEETWRLKTANAALWVQGLLRSLGALAHTEQTPMGWQVAATWNRDLISVRSVRPLGKTASCRCIEVSDPRGLFVAGDGIVTHNTETLISLAFNSLVQGSGFIYVDGKGDNSLWAKIYSICRSMGREDDLLVVNYMTGGRDVFGPQKNKLSNTLNPFSTGSAGGLTELLVGLMDEAGGDNAMWKGRAISLISGVMFALVYMRENEGLLLDVDQIRDYLILENIQKLAKRRDLPANILQSIRAYLRSLPGYQENAQKQSETVLDQHGYLQMQFTRILGSLSDTYGYIFRTNLGEVDFFDVVINRRILVVLLPALEKSPDELGNLGKIIVASLKQMMSTGLGDTLEGDYQDIIEIKPTNSPAPYTCILDEYGYYVVKGAAVMPAQARSLGFSMVFAGQDYPAFKKNNNQEEAVSTIGNCNIKIFMKLEDPTDTFELFKQSVGEALVSKTGGFAFETGVIGGYMDEKRASIERRSRGDLLDLKDQGPGEAHIIFKSTLVRAQMFYVNPAKVKRIQLNHFLRVEPPDRQDMLDLDSGIEELTQRLTNTALLQDYVASTRPHARVQTAQAVLDAILAKGKPLEQAIAGAIAAAHQLSYSNLEAMNQGIEQDYEEDEDEDDENTINVFSSDEEENEESEEDVSQYGDGDEDYGSYEDDPLHPNASSSKNPVFLDEEKTTRNLMDMEMAAGSSREEAQRQAQAMAADMARMSTYPNPQNTPEHTDPDEIIGIIQEIGEDLGERDD